jgi:glycerol kinase
MQWLRDGLGIISTAAESEQLASNLTSNKGVYVVPAFTGLGAPYWRPDVRGAILGLTLAAGPAEVTRATLESVAYLTGDLFNAMAQDGIKPTSVRVDGGMVANNWFLQFLADTLNMSVIRPVVMETTALGAAYLAGRHLGVYGDLDAFTQLWQCDAQFEPTMNGEQREKLLNGWRDAVRRAT